MPWHVITEFKYHTTMPSPEHLQCNPTYPDRQTDIQTDRQTVCQLLCCFKVYSSLQMLARLTTCPQVLSTRLLLILDYWLQRKMHVSVQSLSTQTRQITHQQLVHKDNAWIHIVYCRALRHTATQPLLRVGLTVYCSWAAEQDKAQRDSHQVGNEDV